MAKLVAQNHPALHTIAEEITTEEIENGSVAKWIEQMKKALRDYAAEGFVGVAIAAPQIGLAKRMFLIEDQSDDRDSIPYMVAINPKIIKASKKSDVVGEGCLSVPEHYGAVRRSKNVTMRAFDENGKEFERGAGGLLAQIFQHECDHLDGTLFVDRADKVWHKDEMHESKLREAKYERE